MSENLEVVRKGDYLHLTISGDFSPAGAKHAVDVLADRCSQEQCYKVLFDCRSVLGEMPGPDRYELAQYGARVLGPRIKSAMLAREDQISPDRFFENVAVNRGLTLKVFSDLPAAIEWLMK